MGIMNVLAELHQEEGLKLNLKFEIEVLCKTLSLDINVSMHTIFTVFIQSSRMVYLFIQLYKVLYLKKGNTQANVRRHAKLLL